MQSTERRYRVEEKEKPVKSKKEQKRFKKGQIVGHTGTSQCCQVRPTILASKRISFPVIT